MSVDDDTLDALSRAYGVKALIDAHQKARRAVFTGRRNAQRATGSLGDVLAEALRLSEAQKADGVPRAERQAGIDRALRAAWPQTREWKYRCSKCDDYGLVMGECPGVEHATCGRTRPHLPHEFGTPCWCPAGARHQEKTKATGGEDITQAGKTSKPTKLGRW